MDFANVVKQSFMAFRNAYDKAFNGITFGDPWLGTLQTLKPTLTGYFYL